MVTLCLFFSTTNRLTGNRLLKIFFLSQKETFSREILTTV
jgi:hypothetical protein